MTRPPRTWWQAHHRRFLRRLARRLVPRAAWQRRRWPDLEPARPRRHQLRRRRRLRPARSGCVASRALARTGLAGRSDMVIAGGMDTFNDIFMYMCFQQDAGPVADLAMRSRSTRMPTAPFSAKETRLLVAQAPGRRRARRRQDLRRHPQRRHLQRRQRPGDLRTESDRGKPRRCTASLSSRLAVTPDTIELVEAHGTGTRAGTPPK